MAKQLNLTKRDFFWKLENKITQLSQSIPMGCLLDRGIVINTTEEKFEYVHEVFLSVNHLDKMNFDEKWKMRVERTFCSSDSSEHKNDALNDFI